MHVTIKFQCGLQVELYPGPQSIASRPFKCIYHLNFPFIDSSIWLQDALLLLLLLSRFSRVRLCATPETAAHQAPSSLGFSRPEHWSGLPFPSPVHESEKWKWSHSVVSDPQWPHGLQPARLLHPCDFPGKSTGVGCHCLLRLESIHMYNLHVLTQFFKSTHETGIVILILPKSKQRVRDF